LNLITSTNSVFFSLKSQLLFTLTGITIRPSTFTEIPINVPALFSADMNFVARLSELIDNTLNQHDIMEPRVRHQAIILVRLTDDAADLARSLNTYRNEEFAVSITSGTASQANIQLYSQGYFRVGIVCRMLLEGYDNSKISTCLIMRNVHPSSKVLFAQFVGRACRMSRFQDGSRDPVNAAIISFPQFGQRLLWQAMEELNDVDPVDNDE